MGRLMYLIILLSGEEFGVTEGIHFGTGKKSPAINIKGIFVEITLYLINEIVVE